MKERYPSRGEVLGGLLANAAGPGEGTRCVWCDSPIMHGALPECIAALRKRAEKLESFKVAHDEITGNGWLERAHAVAREEPGRLGANVWHIAVERAERLGACLKGLEKIVARSDSVIARNIAAATIAEVKK